MVDFNNETTVAQPPINLLQILIIQKREYFLDAVEAFEKQEELGFQPSIGVVKGRTKNLYYGIRSLMLRKMDKEEFEKLQELLKGSELQDFIEAFQIMDAFLDKVKVITIDTRKSYDRTRVSEEDRVKGV